MIREYKDQLVEEMSEDLVDRSVEDGDIDDGLRTESIWQNIRDEHVADATVVLVLIGRHTSRHTWSRKFVDWEIGSALNQSRNNSRCGVLGIFRAYRSQRQHRWWGWQDWVEANG